MYRSNEVLRIQNDHGQSILGERCRSDVRNVAEARIQSADCKLALAEKAIDFDRITVVPIAENDERQPLSD
jgi:hypothetical protein